MFWRLLADIIVIIHLLFVIFMVVGFLLTLTAVIGVYVFQKGGWFARFFDWKIFRWAHLCGIAFVGALTILGMYCPLTNLENALRRRAQDPAQYSGSFIVHYLEKLLYPNIAPIILTIATIFIAVFTVLTFILRSPARKKPGK